MTEKEFEMVKAMYESYNKQETNWTYSFAVDAVNRILETREIYPEDDYELYSDLYDDLSGQIGSKFLNDPYILRD